MSHHTKLDEKLEGVDNFRAWKYRISLVLAENELDSYIHEEVPVPEGDEAKALRKKKLVMDKRNITYSIKDHLIPHVSSLNPPKAMFDFLTKPKDDSKKPIEECKGTECGNHPVLLYKGLSDQGTTGSSR